MFSAEIMALSEAAHNAATAWRPADLTACQSSHRHLLFLLEMLKTSPIAARSAHERDALVSVQGQVSELAALTDAAMMFCRLATPPLAAENVAYDAAGNMMPGSSPARYEGSF